MPAQAIVAGQNYGTDVGGGISQYASALLNAAYVGGLDITGYQSPSLHDPHEPLGREATISFPTPDLKLRNSTPVRRRHLELLYRHHHHRHPVLHRLRHRGPDRPAGHPSGACQKVHTVRTRTYTTGKTATDSLDAFYYPGPGLPC